MSEMLHRTGEDAFGRFETICPDTRPALTPRVSIVMSAYDAGSYLAASVRSILEQDFKDFEFVIVDDGSRDDTLAKLKEFLREDARIIVVRNLENIGLTKSLVRGISLSRGEYIARQDADDVSAVNRLSTQLQFLPRYDFVCCRTRVNEVKVSPKRISALFFKQVLLLKNVFVHGSFLMKRTVYDELGGYDVDYVYAQDYDFVVRLVQRPYKVKFLPDVLYFSRKSDQCISRGRLEAQNEFCRRVKERFRDPGKFLKMLISLEFP